MRLYPPNTTFYVDNLKIDNISISTQDYDNRGRITNNELGQYQYTSSAKPYQNTSVFTTPSANTYYSTRQLQNVTYTAFKSPIKIEENGSEFITFGYNAMGQRNIMYYGNTNTNKLIRPFRRYYSADGSMEIKATFVAGSTTPTSVEFITYIGGDAYSAPALVKSDGITQSYFYLHRDYQGSILAITNATGLVQEKRMFDAWGGILKIQNGIGTNLTKLTFFDRGYTGHEHLEGVGLINMNARLYDPKLHRFLQPDNFIQDPNNTQNYNRYAYCINNPLKYTDPSGNIFGIDDVIIGAIIIGAMIGAGSYAIMVVTGHAELSFKGAFMSTLMGAISGAATAGIAQGFGTICNFSTAPTGFWSGAAVGASTGFVTGVTGSALTTVMNGGSLKLGQLLKSGAIGAVIGGIIGGVQAGNRAVNEGEANFWSGKKEIDLSKGIGAHDVSPEVLNSKVFGKYVGKYNDIKIYEHKSVGYGSSSGGMTLPPDKIIVGKGTYSLLNKVDKVRDLFRHEFGHILQSRQEFVGIIGFYRVIASESIVSAGFHGWISVDGSIYNHQNYWTETWANKLSNDYYSGNAFINKVMYPIEPLSLVNKMKFSLGIASPPFPIFTSK